MLVVCAVVLIPWVLDGSSNGVSGSTRAQLPVPPSNSVLRRKVIDLNNPSSAPRAATLSAQTALPADAEPESPALPLSRPEVNTDSEPHASSDSPFANTGQTPATERTAATKQPSAAAPPKVAAAKPVSQAPKPKRAAPAPEVPAVAVRSAPAQAASSSLDSWAVQVGSFASQDNAEGLQGRLKSNGYRAFTTRHSTGVTTVFRVRVGPEQDRAAAQRLADRLSKEGQEVAVVRHP